MKEREIIFFDGVCGLCNGFVSSLVKIIKRKNIEGIYFSPLQGDVAKKILPEEKRNSLESIIYWQEGQSHERSTAVLKILKKIGGVFILSQVFLLAPLFLRDKIYNWVAKNRYRWFGKNELCRVPLEEEKKYFLP